jgi:hypothetical protein
LAKVLALEMVAFTSSQPLKTLGDGVFSYRFRAYDDDDNVTVWVFIFYEKVAFVGRTKLKSD